LLGNTAATYLQTRLAVDLLLAIYESSLGDNHPIKKENTKRSVLWYGPDPLSNAGVHDGFDEINYIESLHLVIPLDRRVVNGVLDELKGLVAPKRRDEPAAAANASVRKPIGPAIDAKILTTPRALATDERWLAVARHYLGRDLHGMLGLYAKSGRGKS
jgi:hypothetical protein